MRNATTLAGSLLVSALLFFPLLTFGAVEISDGSVQGLWHLDGDSADATGNGHNGTDSNITYASSDCKFAGTSCASFNGSNSIINLAGAIDLTSINQVTVGYWTKISSQPSAYKRVFSDPTHDLIIAGVTNGNAYRWFSQGNDLYGGTVTSSWKFVVMTYDGALKTIYLDNTVIATTTETGTFGNSDTFAIGSQGAGEWYSGNIQEIFFATKAISADTVSALWNDGDGDVLCVTAGCGGGAPSSTPTSTIQDAINYADFFIDFCAFLIVVVMLLFRRRT